MSETNHPWSRDPVAQAAVRAAEDDAANWRRLEVGEVIEASDEYLIDGVWRFVPSVYVGDSIGKGYWPMRRRRVPPPDHRELPAAVAELRERVARIEGHCRIEATKQARLWAAVIPKSVSGSSAEAHENKGGTMQPGWIRAWNRENELAAERDAARAECERLRGTVAAMEGQRRMDIEREIDVEEAWESCDIRQHWPDDEPGTSHRYAESMRLEIVRLRARVAELEAERDAAEEECGRLRHLLKTKESECETHHPWVHPSAAPAANAGGEAKQEPVAWGFATPDGKLMHVSTFAPVPGTATVVPLYAAPQPPRGWLTEEEREEVQWAADAAYDKQHPAEDTLRSLLARSTPPKVKVPSKAFIILNGESIVDVRDRAWIAAIREAGGEVEE